MSVLVRLAVQGVRNASAATEFGSTLSLLVRSSPQALHYCTGENGTAADPKPLLHHPLPTTCLVPVPEWLTCAIMTHSKWLRNAVTQLVLAWLAGWPSTTAAAPSSMPTAGTARQQFWPLSASLFRLHVSSQQPHTISSSSSSSSVRGFGSSAAASSQCDCPTLGGPTPDIVTVEYDEDEVDRYVLASHIFLTHCAASVSLLPHNATPSPTFNLQQPLGCQLHTP